MAKKMERKPEPVVAPKEKKTYSETTVKRLVTTATNEAVKEATEDIGVKKFTCPMCGRLLSKDKFYNNTNPNFKTGISVICKDCAREIANPIDKDGNVGLPTKASVIETMLYLNRPFYQSLWESSLLEASNSASGKVKTNVYNSYIKNISMPQYKGKTFLDSDLFGNMNPILINDETKLPEDKEVQEMYEKNKRTTLRMLGYDPFENEPLAEQPLLYSKLVNYFDDSVKEDGLKLEAVIEIVQTFKDVKSINDAISQVKKDLNNSPQAISTIKSLADTKQKMIKSALDLAKDNGISVNYNNKKSKGAGTLSGLLKEMSEMNLDDVEINTFDYETGLAMSELEQRSYENQMKQLNPDENDWEREVVHQKQLLFQLQKERDSAVECARLLKRENKDLKTVMQDNGIIDENCEVIN